MAAVNMESGAMNAAGWDFTPHDHEVLNPADVYRCERTTDVVDRIMAAALDALVNAQSEHAGTGLDFGKSHVRLHLVTAYMQAAATVYAAECAVAKHVQNE